MKREVQEEKRTGKEQMGGVRPHVFQLLLLGAASRGKGDAAMLRNRERLIGKRLEPLNSGDYGSKLELSGSNLLLYNKLKLEGWSWWR